ncbi:MAG: hypothetical protein H6Q41_919 [Deltaproteobacteria bacterium]|nr:hypothetical protein [Deltaproteobacteria bacterium]
MFLITFFRSVILMSFNDSLRFLRQPRLPALCRGADQQPIRFDRNQAKVFLDLNRTTGAIHLFRRRRMEPANSEITLLTEQLII